MKTICEPTGRVLDSGDIRAVPNGVVMNNAFYPTPPFLVVDGAPPAGSLDDWFFKSGSWEMTQTAEGVLAAFREQLAAELDRAVLAVYDKPCTLAREYEAREADAHRFVEDGTVGAYLRGFMDGAALEAEDAATIVLDQAKRYREAEPLLAAVRMRKFEIRRATTKENAQAVYNHAMQALLGLSNALP